MTVEEELISEWYDAETINSLSAALDSIIKEYPYLKLTKTKEDILDLRECFISVIEQKWK